MVLLLSDTAAWWIAIGVVTVIGGLIGLITLNGDMKAFDLIPEKIFGENHKKVVKGQRGNYVFETQAERRYERVYVWEEATS